MSDCLTIWEVFVPHYYLRTEFKRTQTQLVISTISRMDGASEILADQRGYERNSESFPMADFDYPMHLAAACKSVGVVEGVNP